MRILIFGPPGSGKSTIARQLSEKLEIEAIHLDCYYWKPGWEESDPSEWSKTVSELMQRDEWVMDGNYLRSLRERLDKATDVLYLEISLIKSVYRVFSRWMKYFNQNRPDMGEGCIEKMDLEFIKWVFYFKKQVEPAIFQKSSNHPNFRLIKSKLDLKNWLGEKTE